MRLTPEQWQAQKAPFGWIEFDARSGWTKTHYEIVAKWLDANVQGWWYWDGNISASRHAYIFERTTDRVLFKLWVSDDPFQREGGEIEIVSVTLEA